MIYLSLGFKCSKSGSRRLIQSDFLRDNLKAGGFTKYGAITPFRKSPVTSIRPIPYANPVQTPLAKLRAQDVTKKTDIEKLTKKYQKVVKDPNFKAQKKKYGIKPQLGGGKPEVRII